jgi:phosphate-selective porin OprO/OprP
MSLSRFITPCRQCILAWIILALLGLASRPAFSQSTNLPPRTDPQAKPASATPTSTSAPAPEPANREAALEARIQQLEDLVQQLAQRLELVTPPSVNPAPNPPQIPQPPSPSLPSGRADDIGARVGGAAATEGPFGPAMGTTTPMPAPVLSPPSVPSGISSENIGRRAGGGAAYAGPFAPTTNRFDMPFEPGKQPLVGNFSSGFGLATEDDEFLFKFNNLTQIDYRGYQPTPNTPLNNFYHSTFGFPRMWLIFSGRLTKTYEYFLVPAFAFDQVNLLDAFLNIRMLDSRIQFKIGRYKTPFTYEFYNLPINALITPERSLFFNNFALNRDVGAMLWGSWLDKRIDYAAGVFNGDRNFYIDRNSSPSFAGIINFKPLATRKDSLLENFNFGGSVLTGSELNPPQPPILRTNVATSGSSFFGVPFLAFNSNIIESGMRTLWDVHAAWYYRSLSLIGEWGGGYQSYSTIAQPLRRTALPVSGYYVQMGYFLTGETVGGRGFLQPNRDFSIRPGKFGTGAIEATGRYSTLTLGPEVFTNNLANEANWSREAQLIDVGVNWYLNKYIKIYLGWEHAIFGKPVLYDVDKFQLTNDMYWTRFQIYF